MTCKNIIWAVHWKWRVIALEPVLDRFLKFWIVKKRALLALAKATKVTKATSKVKL